MDKSIKTFDHKKTYGYTEVTNIQLNSTLLVTYVDLLFWMTLKALSLRMKAPEKWNFIFSNLKVKKHL